MSIKPSDYKLKLIIGIPFSGRYVPPEWAMALAGLTWPMNIRYAYVPIYGMPREQAREEIVAAARHHKAEYIWMLDDDVTPPPETASMLIRELDQYPAYDIIAAIVPSRTNHPEPMIYLTPAGGAHWRWKIGDIFEIAEAATACMLIRTSLFETLPKPWFMDLNTAEEAVAAGAMVAGAQDRGAMTDDLYFCQKAQANGHRILSHGGVLCTHWGRKRDQFILPPDSYPFQPPEDQLPPDTVKLADAMCIGGWMSTAELVWLAERARESKEIVEIGSFYGRSTRALADNTSGRVTAVDVWTPTTDTEREFVNRPPDWAWDEFRMNMLGLTNVHAIRLPSIEAAAIVPADVKFDMIFIDADHTYEGCSADITSWLPHLAEGGLLCGHDYTWPGVKKAVSELLPTAQRAIEKGDLWYVPVNKDA